jgi:hypothetical protein
MPQPDIIQPIDPANPTGPEAWVWIEAVEITRNGRRSVSGIPQLEDKWRISLPLRASLAVGGAVVRDAGGGEVSVPSPVRSPSYDIADLLHDEAVQQLAVLIRDVTMRIASGELKPLDTTPLSEFSHDA